LTDNPRRASVSAPGACSGEQLGLFDERHGSARALAEAPLVVRTSRRARRLILRLVPPHTLELVVPRGVGPKEIEAFVAEQRAWIESARAEIAARSEAQGAEGLPQRMELRALDRSLRVIYRRSRGVRRRPSEIAGALIVAVPDERPETVLPVLRGWLLRQSAEHLKPWLAREARVMDRTPSRVQVRLQRSRWGSCSSTGCISLNASLLFLEPAIVRYLLIHELCHLRWMNHSKRYWAHVARFEPDYEALDRKLAAAWSEIPFWVFARDS
jgi:predicted metal-dependent hydrolase